MPWRLILVFAALALASCLQRNYDNPFLTGAESETDAAWKLDRDGNGIADSVEVYARDCQETPSECLKRAREKSAILAANGPKGKPDKPDSVPVPPRDTVVVPPKDTVVVPPKDTVGGPIPPRDTVVVPIPPRDTVRDTIIVKPPEIAVTGIEAQAIYIPMSVAKAKPSVTILPRDAKNQGYTLQSMDEGIVKVAGTDLVPVKPGTAWIRARSDQGGFAVDFEATVLLQDTNRYETGITASPMELVAGAEAKAPDLVWQPADVTNHAYTMTSSDPARVLVVMEGGIPKCKPIAAGTADMTVKTVSKGLTAVFRVTVKAAPILNIPVLAISAPDIVMDLGAPDQDPKVAYTPALATNRGYSLTSDNSGIVAFAGSRIHAVSGGSAHITIKSLDGPSSVFLVTVRVRVQSILGPQDLKMAEGDKLAIEPAFVPANPDNKAFTMSSDSTSVVSVSGNVLEAKKNGTAVITLTSADGGKTATFRVTVSKKGKGG
ncbi:MAG: putative alpha-glucanase [Fibrobacteres bacterium]|nr:putative alpha-glucanase [Fibrobacterota bacterium]